MQRIKIDIYIADLLYQYDCVIVPEFGGFVANLLPATINETQHVVNPPSKKISFNRNLKTNDGLLGNHIAERRAISYAAANDLIQAFVEQSLDGLNKGDKINIEKVGTLYLDAERNIQFQAADKNDFLLDSYGMGSLRLQPITREERPKTLEENIQKVIPITEGKRRNYWKVATFALLFIMSSMFLNNEYNWVDGSDINYTSLGFSDSVSGIYEYREGPQLETEQPIEATELQLAELDLIPYEFSEDEPTKIIIDNRKEDLKSKIDNTFTVDTNQGKKLNFHVMGGCFSKLSNAEGLVKSLQAKGFDARLLGDYKSLFAVSFGSFANRDEARQLLIQVKNNENSQAWLLEKPY